MCVCIFMYSFFKCILSYNLYHKHFEVQDVSWGGGINMTTIERPTPTSDMANVVLIIKLEQFSPQAGFVGLS